MNRQEVVCTCKHSACAVPCKVSELLQLSFHVSVGCVGVSHFCFPRFLLVTFSSLLEYIM